MLGRRPWTGVRTRVLMIGILAASARAMLQCRRTAIWVTSFLCLATPPVWAEQADPETQVQLRELRQQNDLFQQQLRQQQALIDDLNRKVAAFNSPKGETSNFPSQDPRSDANKALMRAPMATALGKVHLGGEGAVSFFNSGSHGQFPNGEFRVDEAKLFIEVPVMDSVYVFSELNLFAREDPNINVNAGELYVDLENLSRFWNQENLLSLRMGRIDIPFGEEYLNRDAIDNPLISHSIMDFWGVDEGVELYGSWRKLSYVLAAQNGGHSSLRDFNGDKAVVGRVGFDPKPWLHLSASAMRTGDLDAKDDYLSELWLGSGFVHGIGSPATTRFSANVFQGDVQLRFGQTAVKAWGGVLQYDDNDASRRNSRDVYFYSVEAVQPLSKKVYAAARWSQVFADGGFPLIGNGSSARYFADRLTTDLSLLSLGLGYRLSRQLVFKAEYSWEFGRELDGTGRHHEDLLALQAAFAF